MRRLIVAILVGSMSHASLVFAQGPLQQSARRTIQQESQVPPQSASTKKILLWTGMAAAAAGIGLTVDTYLKEECINRAGAPGTASECLQTTTNNRGRALGLTMLGAGATLLTLGIFRNVEMGPRAVSYRVRF